MLVEDSSSSSVLQTKTSSLFMLRRRAPSAPAAPSSSNCSLPSAADNEGAAASETTEEERNSTAAFAEDRIDDGDGAEVWPLLRLTASQHAAANTSSAVPVLESRRVLWGRKIARWLERRFPQYFAIAATAATDHGAPSASTSSPWDQGWAYFENVVLPRRAIDAPHRMAPPGTPDSELFPIWATSVQDLRDFGTGVAVYFETLRALALICLVAGLLYLPSLHYYSREGGYRRNPVLNMTNNNNASEEGLQHNTILSNPFLTSSLICTETVWVPCPTCTLSQFEPNRIAQIYNKNSTTTAPTLTFVLKNNCAPLRWQEGINQVVVVAFLLVSVTALGYHQRRLELQYDEAVLTASDFSVVVQNPPDDAVDPEEWKTFFAQFGEVVYCTIALDNEALVQALVQRRVLLQQASYKIPEQRLATSSSRKTRGVELEQDTFSQDVPESLQDTNLLAKIEQSNHRCRAMLRQTYAASEVFVVFETESAQRAALAALSVGQRTLATNDTSVLEKHHLFRGTHLLDVLEAKEPSVIRWKDLKTARSVRRGVMSYSEF